MQKVIDRNILLPLFENAPHAVLVLDQTDLYIVAANAVARERLGQSMRALQRLTLMDALPDLPPRRLRRFLRLFIASGRSRMRQQLDIKGSHAVVYDVEIVRIPDDVSIVLQIQDVTQAIAALRIADQAKAQLSTAINHLSDGFVLYDADDRLVICNDSYRVFYPESAPAMQTGATFETILRYGLQRGQYVDGIGREDDWLRERMDAHHNTNGPIEQKLANGRWLRIYERPTPDGGRVGLRVDITTMKEQQQALRRLAITDELTGLRNRRNLLEDIANMADDLREGDAVVVFHLDLDRFKAVNDVYGHEAGDHVLKHCAAVLESTVTQGDFAARVGGDEFIVVRRMTYDHHDVASFADHLIQRMMDPIGYAGQIMHIGASIGIAALELNLGMGARGTVLTAADLALCEAKKAGGTAVFFERYMRDQILTSNDLARELQVAMERHEFEAYFQPQIDTRTMTCIGFEALLRWNHPKRGVLAAGVFLDIAQRAGLTDALDTMVMDEACAALRWLANHDMPDISVSINMSTAQLSDPRLLQRLDMYLNKHNVPRHLLRIELLESTLLDDRTTHYLANVKALNDAGFIVELDDFGTGHAAIAALRKCRVSQIKIDRGFVRHIDKDEELQKLTRAIIGLAHSLEIGVLCEGVETAEERDCLLAMGCPLAQGWLFGKAVPLQEISSFLTQYPPAA